MGTAAGKSIETADIELPVGRHLLRVHSTGSGSLYEYLLVDAVSHGADLVRRSYRRIISRKLLATVVPAPVPLGADWHFNQVAPLLGFALGQYERRRWSPAFLEKLWKSARDDLNDTIYFEVLWGPQRKRAATMRYVIAPFAIENGTRVPRGTWVRHYYGDDFSGFRALGERQPDDEIPQPLEKLPVAHYLGIDFPLRVWKDEGVEIEAGSYAIDPNLSPSIRWQVQQLLWLQYWEVLNETPIDAEAIYGRTFYTFGDRVSKRLYEPLGYEPVRQFQRQGVVSSLSKTDPLHWIEKDGNRWLALVHFPEAVAELFTTVAANKFRDANDGGLLAEGILQPNSPSFFGFRWLPVADTVIADLGSASAKRRFDAALAIADFIGLAAEHEQVARASLKTPERARRAISNFKKHRDMVLKIRERLVELTQSDLDARWSVERTLWLLRVHHDTVLKMFGSHALFDEILFPLASDSDQTLALLTLQWMTEFYHWQRLLEPVVGVWPDFDGGVELLAARTKAQAELRAAGWSADEIETATQATVRSLHSTATYEKTTGRPQILRALFTLAAIADAARHYSASGIDWRNLQAELLDPDWRG